MRELKQKMIRLGMLSMLLLCACVPTPEEEYVINRRDNTFEEEVFATPDSTAAQDSALSTAGQYEVPSHWSEELFTKYLKIKIDADIVLPKMEKFPVYRIQAGEIDESTKKTVLLEILPGIYEYADTAEATAEEWKDALACATRGTEKTAKDGSVQYVPWEFQDYWINNCFEEYKQAKPAAEMFRSAEDVSLTELQEDYVRVHYGENKTGAFGFEKTTIYAQSFGYRSIVQPESFGLYELWDTDETKIIELSPKLSEKEAIRAAEDLLVKLHIDGVSLQKIEKGRVFSDMELRQLSCGYYLTYTRTFGYPVILVDRPVVPNGALQFDDSSEYRKAWRKEDIFVYVDEEGVRYFEWLNPVENQGCIQESVKLLPFSEMQKAIRKTLRASMANYDGLVFEGYVLKEMTLTGYAQTLRDGKGYVYSPAWYLLFDVYHLNDAAEMDFKQQYPDQHQMSLMFNAVDGSLIQMLSAEDEEMEQ